MTYKKGNKIDSACGKTKDLYEVIGEPNLCILENLSNITANDDPSLTKQFKTKAISATNTTCNVFELLKLAGIPTAYVERHSDTGFVSQKCDLVPLEVIIRRFADGSFLKRFPHLRKQEGEGLHYFSELCFELFLKTKDGSVTNTEGKTLVEGLKYDGKVVDDPLLAGPYTDKNWKLRHPKIPEYDEKGDLGISLTAQDILGSVEILEIEALARKTFLLLERAWVLQGKRLIDFKIEFGVTSEGKLVIIDVIDNDSWRLRTFDWQEMSKQLFRDGKTLEVVEEAYAEVSRLSDNLLDIPEQPIVFWTGSQKYNFLLKELTVSDSLDLTTISAHKNPVGAMRKLHELVAKYPFGGVIIAIAGKSNGLGPTLASNTSWPVISCPPGIDKNPNDIWSSVNLPSQVPAATILNVNNGLLFALEITGKFNPIHYMHRQYEIENLKKWFFWFLYCWYIRVPSHENGEGFFFVIKLFAFRINITSIVMF